MAVTMKSFGKSFGKILVCGCVMIATAGFSPAQVQGVAPIKAMPVADSSLCVDSMETVPQSDDVQATPIADKTDGGCQVPSEPVAV